MTQVGNIFWSYPSNESSLIHMTQGPKQSYDILVYLKLITLLYINLKNQLRIDDKVNYSRAK
jgi:hypothetical protein